MPGAESAAEVRVPVAMTPPHSEEEFERIFREQWPRVYAVVFRLTANREEAEELALDAFMRLHTQRPHLDQEGGLEAWLYRVVMRLGLNALRARKRRLRHESDAARELATERDWSAESASAAGGPADELVRAEERARVRAVLATLPERSAALVLLRHSGFSYREIARTLELAPGSIGTLLARAEREFERRYGAAGEGS